MLMRELALYSQHLTEKPRCMILTKTDLFTKEKPPAVPEGWLSMSAVTGENVEKVVMELGRMVKEVSGKEQDVDIWMAEPLNSPNGVGEGV